VIDLTWNDPFYASEHYVIVLGQFQTRWLTPKMVPMRLTVYDMREALGRGRVRNLRQK